MIKFDYKKTANINANKIKATAAKLSAYISHLQSVAKKRDYKDSESSIQLGFDKKLRDEVKKMAKKIGRQKLKNIVVIGIGGSNLGTMAVYEALQHKTKPEILFLDTVSSLKIKQTAFTLNKLKPQEFVIVAVSKSGTTTETISNLEALISLLKQKKADIKKRIVCITEENSKLWKLADNKLAISKMVGGRYSVFSAVGLLPLYLAGIDIDKLHKGAARAVTDNVQKNINKNFSIVSAGLIYLHNQKGINIHNTFIFNPELESLGKWYRQLMAESIGKKKNLKGKVVRKGITPIVSIGSTDLHSMAQLYFGGPKDKFTNIVYGKNDTIVSVSKNLSFDGLISNIKGKSFENIMNAIFGGVKAAYKKNNLPYLIIELGKISEQSLGYYLQFRMIEMMYLAQLLKVNAFNQPSVEDYKKETRKLLKS